MASDGIEYLKMRRNSKLLYLAVFFLSVVSLSAQSLYSVQLVNNRLEKVSSVEVDKYSEFSDAIWIDELRFAAIGKKQNSNQSDVVSFDLLNQNFRQITNTPAAEHGLAYYDNELFFVVNQGESSLLYEVPAGRYVGRSKSLRIPSIDVKSCVRLTDGSALCENNNSNLTLTKQDGSSVELEQQMILLVKPKQILTGNTNLPLFQIYEYPQSNSIHSFYLTESIEGQYFHNGKLYRADGKVITATDDKNKSAVFVDLTNYLEGKKIIDFDISPSGGKLLILAQ